MDNTEKEIITLPVAATYRIINGEPVQISAEYVTAPAEDVARFFLARYNMTERWGELIP